MGGAEDMAEHFDQTNKETLYSLMTAAGTPGKIVSAYKRFQEELKVRNTIGGE